ncbi:MAG: hypothetical protein IKB77_03550, partial [Lentisphaeria bacterium]|nr:hypothetical protein [Lentisphaeria bacterium]
PASPVLSKRDEILGGKEKTLLKQVCFPSPQAPPSFLQKLLCNFRFYCVKSGSSILQIKKAYKSERILL